jgi:ABC-type antimicrobial peptide transport system permease subunit
MAAVAAIGLLTMLSISVFERQREIGVMRSVGAGSGTVAAQFLVEGLIVGVIGWLIGIPLSLGVSAAFKEVIPWDAFEFSYPPAIILLGLAGTLILVALASLWPALAAARKRVSDILRYQ